MFTRMQVSFWDSYPSASGCFSTNGFFQLHVFLTICTVIDIHCKNLFICLPLFTIYFITIFSYSIKWYSLHSGAGFLLIKCLIGEHNGPCFPKSHILQDKEEGESLKVSACEIYDHFMLFMYHKFTIQIWHNFGFAIIDFILFFNFFYAGYKLVH